MKFFIGFCLFSVLPQTYAQELAETEEQETALSVLEAEVASFVAVLSSECAVTFSAQDSVEIVSHLLTYFNSVEGNALLFIYKSDLTVDQDLVATEKILSTYGCSLEPFAIEGAADSMNASSSIAAADAQVDAEMQRIEAEMEARIQAEKDSILEYYMNQAEEKTVSESSTGLATRAVTTTLSAQAATAAVLPTQAEYDALMALYNATDGPNWTNNTGWVDADPNVIEDVSGWYGIKTNGNGNVVQLDLSNIGLTGSIPASLGNLTNLTHLSIRNNSNLAGSIPASLGHLSNLTYLNISYNEGLTGSIPAALGDLTNLTYLIILYNEGLTGSIPASLGHLSNLTYLNMSYNEGLTGSIPASLGDLTNLIVLYLDGNSNLTGSIPPELGNLSNLANLFISYNEGLTGSIPAVLGDLTNLSILYISNNEGLTGSIPASLGNLSRLAILDLSNNEGLTGSIPASLGDLTNLSLLYISNNEGLTGSIPPELGNLSKLIFLYLDGNSNLTGSIPASLGNLSNLYILDISNNEGLTGSIPLRFSELSTLSSIVFDNNQFTFSGFLELKQNYTGTTFSYSPQGTVDVEKTITVLAGENLTLTTEIDRNTNPPSKYQWYKNNVPISTLSTANHTIVFSDSRAGDSGAYHYIIQNDEATDLTLQSEQITVNVSDRDPTCSFSVDFYFYPHACGTKFMPIHENENDCAIVGYEWNFGDGTTSAESEPFHVYASQDVFEVTLELTYHCHADCGNLVQTVSHTVDVTEDVFEQNRTIHVNSFTLDSVLAASASSYSDSWMMDYDDASLSGTHPYLNGARGVWRNDGSYVYRADRGDRNVSSVTDIGKDGTFQLESFNWAYSELEAIPGWLTGNTITQYSPYSYEVENEDILAQKSSALYGYGGQLPVAVGGNMGHSEMAFTGFEELNSSGYAHVADASQKGSGNWTVSIGARSGQYEIFDIHLGVGNLALINAPISELEEIDTVRVYAYQLLPQLGPFGFLLKRHSVFRDVAILCKESYGEFDERTKVAFDKVIDPSMWLGRMRYYRPYKNGIPADISETVAHTGTKSLRIESDKTIRQNHIKLISGKEYRLSAWLSVNDKHLYIPVLGTDLGIRLRFYGEEDTPLGEVFMEPAGNLIEGWQKVEGSFFCPEGTTYFTMKFEPGTAGTVYVDDLRLFPQEGNMQSYVYELDTYRLKAVLDENNYASLYYYDAEGNLHLVKKETERGIKTIQESVSYQKEHE